MATHASILACRLLWTEMPGGLQSIGTQRIRHDWSNLAHKPPPSSLPRKRVSVAHPTQNPQDPTSIFITSIGFFDQKRVMLSSKA